MAFVNEKPPGQSDLWRTIDYDRNAILKRADGLPHGGGSRFILTWNEHVIRFSAYEHVGYMDTNDESKGVKKYWKIFHVELPESCKTFKPQIRQLMSEALQEYGELYGRYDIVRVEVDFDNRI